VNIYEAIVVEPRIRGVLKNQFPVAIEDKKSLRKWLEEAHIHVNDAYAALHNGTLPQDVVDIVTQAIYTLEENAYLVGKMLIEDKGDEHTITYH